MRRSPLRFWSVMLRLDPRLRGDDS